MKVEDFDKAAESVVEALITLSITARQGHRHELIGFLSVIHNMVTTAVEAIDVPDGEYYRSLGGKMKGGDETIVEEFWLGVKNTEDMCPEFNALNNKLVKAAKASKYPTDLVLKSFWLLELEQMYEGIGADLKTVTDNWGAEDWEVEEECETEG